MIEKINKSIENSLTGLTTSILGVAEPIVITNEEETIVPMIVLPDGECLSILDDEKDICVYHKINKKTYVKEENRGYGDRPKVSSNTDMSLLCYGFRDKISQLDAERLITSAIMPYVSIESVEFSRITILSSEFLGIQFFLQPNVFLFRINYRMKEKMKSCN